jgi:hypothetical protein
MTQNGGFQIIASKIILQSRSEPKCDLFSEYQRRTFEIESGKDASF